MNRLLQKCAIISSIAVLFSACQSKEVEFQTDERTVAEKILETKTSSIEIPENTTQAEKLLYLMNVDKSMKSIMILSQKSMIEVARASDENANLNTMKRGQEIVLEEFDKEIPNVISEMSKLYEEFYSPEDLQVLYDFYSTDVAQKFINTMPDLMAQSIPIGENLEDRLSERATKRLHQEIAAKKK